jgi:signal transduction histidine kinase
MRERAKLLGGRLRVSSGAGKGTRIVASVPLNAEP